MPLLAGKTTKHRDHVVVEYAPNEEAMIRDEYWKLVYERGVVRRTDGYDTGRPLVPDRFRLYDLHQDPAEMHNVAADPANAATLVRLRDLLVEHLVDHGPRRDGGSARRPDGDAGILRAVEGLRGGWDWGLGVGVYRESFAEKFPDSMWKVGGRDGTLSGDRQGAAQTAGRVVGSL